MISQSNLKIISAIYPLCSDFLTTGRSETVLNIVTEIFHCYFKPCKTLEIKLGNRQKQLLQSNSH